MSKSARQKVYEILESRVRELALGKVIGGILVLLIIFNVIAAVIETDTGIFQLYGPVFDAFAVFSVLVFTIEYFLRVWCCTENPRYREPVTGRLKYVITPIALIDLFVILPFFLVPFLTFIPGIFSIVRFSRIFWILKIGHYSQSLKTFFHVFRAKRGEIFIAFFVMLLLLVLGSAMIYFAEHSVQPEKFSSVLASMWWGIETMATIGYGDMVPITPLGKCIAGVVALAGVGLFALPAGIFASGFVQELNKEAKEKPSSSICPHCGKDTRELPDHEEHRSR